MQTAVLENGFAVVAGEVVVFNYDGLTRVPLTVNRVSTGWRQYPC